MTRTHLLSSNSCLLLSASVLLLVAATTVSGQQSPSIFVEKFDSSVSYRTDVCDRQRMVWDGSIELPNALDGLNLTTVITNYQVPDENKYFTLVEDPITGEPNSIINPMDPGLFAVILDEAARRAGFKWRDSFAVASPLSIEHDVNKTWTDILLWGVTTFDISMEKWGRSIPRVEMGISYPAGWWDSSIVLVERLSESTRVVNLWSFLSPFTSMVWLTIVFTILVTGFLYWSLEYLDVDADEGDLEDRPLHCVFYAALVFVGSLKFQPKTHAARILSWSWTFWAVIVTCAYTANLASFLVSPKVDVYSISTMEKAIQQNAKICVQNGGVLSSILTAKYGDGLNLVPQDTEQAIFKGVQDGTCHVAAHQMNTFRIYEKNIETNADCTLDSEKRVVQPVPAGMATAIDTGAKYCTSLISHVLDYHMTEMIAEGFVEKAWMTHLNKVGTIDCIKEPPRGGEFFGDSFRLGMQDIGGIFILHASILVGTILLSLFQFYWFGTSDKTLSEIFFVKQARERVGTARESIRQSMTSSPTKAPTTTGVATDARSSTVRHPGTARLEGSADATRHASSLFGLEELSDNNDSDEESKSSDSYTADTFKTGVGSSVWLSGPLDPVEESWSEKDPNSSRFMAEEHDIFPKREAAQVEEGLCPLQENGPDGAEPDGVAATESRTEIQPTSHVDRMKEDAVKLDMHQDCLSPSLLADGAAPMAKEEEQACERVPSTEHWEIAKTNATDNGGDINQDRVMHGAQPQCSQSEDPAEEKAGAHLEVEDQSRESVPISSADNQECD